MAQITINNQQINANEGEYLLNVARKNGIFIPAICYLSGCSPTLACKLCMVEADGKRVYACNAKVKDGMSVATNTPEILAERKAIMQSYCVNHPLECGVCDKSGECELQDFTLLFGVDNEPYFVADSLKKRDSWGQVKYDPSLCILCERCVTACKDNLGEANLKVIKSDSIPQLDSAKWKEKMPKDAFSVWNRAQKGVIGFVGENVCAENPCNDCVECVSVCPVGALGVKSFQYTTNAWELQKVDSTCNLCPSGCKIVLEGKKNAQNEMKLYRVTNDFNFNPICAGGRFGQVLDLEKSVVDLSEDCLNRAISAIKSAKAIIVGGNTTNNEAKFLQSLKNALGVKLINAELENYFKILDILGDCPRARLESIAESKLIISVGGNPKYENPLVRYKINNALKMQKDCAFVFAHALRDNLLSRLSKKFLEIECGCEDAVILAICGILDSAILENLPKIEVDFSTQREIKETIKDENGAEKEVTKKVDSTEKREYYEFFAKCGLEYAKFVELQNMLLSAPNTAPLLLIGADFYANKNAPYLAKILANLTRSGKISLTLNPPTANANGIYQNLVLDSANECGESSDFGAIIGWREIGDFTFDSVNADFTLPYFSAMNDSMVNIDNRLLPINALFSAPKYLEALSANLNLECDFSTPKLANYYDNGGVDRRGVLLEYNSLKSSLRGEAEAIQKNKIDCHESADADSRNDGEKYTNAPRGSILEIKSGFCETSNADKTKVYQGSELKQSPILAQKTNAYLRDITPHFYPYTRYSSNFTTPLGIYVSKDKMQDLALSMGVSVGDEVELIINSVEIKGRIYVDFEMEGAFFAVSPQIANAIYAFGGARFANATFANTTKKEKAQ